MTIKYPVYKPSLSGNERKYINECIDSTWISSKGIFIEQFEKAFADYINTKFAAAVCNGTVAMHLTMLATGIGPGDEVIVPSFTYIASVNPILYVGATPVFVDINPKTWQMDTEDVKLKITERTKAIIAVHLYGHPCDITSLQKICRQKNIFLIEDCAEAIGTKVNNVHVGTVGDISAFSFFGNKTITTGEGGMVVTNNPNLIEKVKHFKGQGLAKNREYWHDILGYNYRMTNICAAMGLAQLERVEETLKKKRTIAMRYHERLQGLPLCTHDEGVGVTHSFWMCSILLDDASKRDSLRNCLAAAEIETRPFFFPVHLMPMYVSNENLPITELIPFKGINLPSYPDLSISDVDFISESIKDFFK